MYFKNQKALSDHLGMSTASLSLRIKADPSCIVKNDRGIKIASGRNDYFKLKRTGVVGKIKKNKVKKDYKKTDEYQSLTPGKKAAYTRKMRNKQLLNTVSRVITTPDVSISFRTVDGATLRYYGKLSNLKVNGKRVEI